MLDDIDVVFSNLLKTLTNYNMLSSFANLSSTADFILSRTIQTQDYIF